MKSHVRENMAKQILYNCMTFAEIGNGDRAVSFNKFAQDIIESIKEKEIEFSDWIINDTGMWRVYVKPLNKFITGGSINECIMIANKEVKRMGCHDECNGV